VTEEENVDVVMEIKKDPFDESKAEVWDFVEPDDTETLSSDKSPLVFITKFHFESSRKFSRILSNYLW
jgi:hypothetical protein